MTREEYDNLQSTGECVCPDCGRSDIIVNRNCKCSVLEKRSNFARIFHINRYHHFCGESFYRSLNLSSAPLPSQDLSKIEY